MKRLKHPVQIHLQARPFELAGEVELPAVGGVQGDVEEAVFVAGQAVVGGGEDEDALGAQAAHTVAEVEGDGDGFIPRQDEGEVEAGVGVELVAEAGVVGAGDLGELEAEAGDELADGGLGAGVGVADDQGSGAREGAGR